MADSNSMTSTGIANAIVSLIFAYLIYRIVRIVRMKRYFSSAEFLAKKQEIANVISEHNELTEYIGEIRSNRSFNIGHSQTGSQSHLATYQNTSKYAYKRDRNIADYGASNVHNASLQVVRNASVDPIKYLIKYFDIDATESKLKEVETLGESISRLENAITNIREREQGIIKSFAPPKFILKHYLVKFQSLVGLSIPALYVPYPTYKFQYVSAGGNSSQVSQIKLDSSTIDALIETLSEKIKFVKSAAGQRSLMTARFRDFIKNRDKYTCQFCGVSTSDEKHLLLEVDHIKPVSKGGLSEESNLQTLCWKCNRTKSNKDLG